MLLRPLVRVLAIALVVMAALVLVARRRPHLLRMIRQCVHCHRHHHRRRRRCRMTALTRCRRCH